MRRPLQHGIERDRRGDRAPPPSWPPRRLPIGAEISALGTHFRVWAPRRRQVVVVVEGGPERALEPEPSGHFSGAIEGVGAGALYRFRLDAGSALYPDPASRCQPEGPHGASQVVDPRRFRWTDAAWAGVELRGQVLYEMHVGTFTREGTWSAAARELPKLEGLCTTLEMMPVADFPGAFGWGYDGVDFFAPTHLYGSPDDLRSFVDRAHALGFGVLLDVVYNHAGPDGNYLPEFSDSYFRPQGGTEWGSAINYDAEGSAGVREFFASNAAYWIDEFHFDGLRLDAIQAIVDGSTPHIVSEIARRVREAARGRRTIVVAENEEQQAVVLASRERGGYGIDAAWNDDLHHSAAVALTGCTEGYYGDHRGTPQELVSAAKYGYLFQGQRHAWKKKPRGTWARGLEPERFVTFLENHDQVANSARGTRLHLRTDPGRMRALTAFVLLGGGTPMLFQGQEFGSTAPFTYFAGHRADLADAVRRGRTEFLAQFPSVAHSPMRDLLDDPADPRVFERCKLDWVERDRNAVAVALHRDLVALRLRDPTIRLQGRLGLDGAVLGTDAFALRFSGEATGADRLLVVNLGADLHAASVPEPLLAPPEGTRWSILWSSEDPRYGGGGMPPPDTDQGWHLKARSAVLLSPLRST